MAQSKGSTNGAGGRKPRAAKRKAPGREDVISAMASLAADRGWTDLSMQDIAAAAGCTLSELFAMFSSKGAILRAMFQQVDAAVLADVDADPFEGDESPRDRLFDVLMRRFDALAPHKEAVRRIAASVRRDPIAATEAAGAAGPALKRSMSWMLECAGMSAGGWRGGLRAKTLTAVYLATLRTWLADDSPDMAKTMSALDSNLRRAEPLLI